MNRTSKNVARVAGSLLKIVSALRASCATTTFASVMAACAISILSVFPLQTSAQSNVDGYVYGSADPTSSVLVESEQLGIRRNVTVGDTGQFRVTGLPIGEYKVTLMKSGAVVQTRLAKVSVGVGTQVTFQVVTGDSTRLDDMVVLGSQMSAIDFSQTEAVTIISEKLVDSIPVPRNATNVALLAPGTVQGDSAFGNFASFGGASIAENAYYVNGFNITDFRNGVGFTQVPFEFYSEFQVKTGGYGAEFGRSLGGVVNATTKRGTNSWAFGVNTYFEPSGLYERPPSTVLDPLDPYPDEADYIIDNRRDKDESITVNVSAGGPIWKDRVFIYALANLRDVSQEDDLLSRFQTQESDDPFYGVKLDINVMEGHLLELTQLSDDQVTNSTQFDDDPTSPTYRQVVGTSQSLRGGKNLIARYTAQLGDLRASALYGNGKLNLTDTSEADQTCPTAFDSRSGAFVQIGCWVGSGLVSKAADERTAYRLDFELPLYEVLGNHNFRFGYDVEQNESVDATTYSAGEYFLYRNATPGSTIPGTGGTVPADVNEIVRRRVYLNGGDFDTNSSALYVEDTWQVTERLSLYLGLRNETFENKNALGGTFIDIDDQLAPRLGISVDPTGEAKSRVFANYGRYYLPVVANTNVRLAGGELFTEDYYQCGPDGAAEACTYDSFGRPTNQGSQIGSTNVLSDGSVPDVREVVDSDIDPMYQDEFIVGFQSEIGDAWLGGIRYIHRDLKSTIEDITINEGLAAYAADNGIVGFDVTADHYVLTNPGTDVTVQFDFEDGAGPRNVFLSAEDLGYPKADRTYNAVELFFESVRRSNWTLQGSYTWSQSIGNSEGYVRSDNGQDDSGITTQFDYPGLAYGAYGYLPNDRRHKIKLFGVYELGGGFAASGNLFIQSGRPRNSFGDCPAEHNASGNAYGGECFFDAAGNSTPRGSAGRTSWIAQLDLGLQYSPEMVQGLKVGVDVFNVLNSDRADEVYEVAIQDTDVDERYGLASSYQQPRYVRFMAEYAFGL